MVELWHKPEWPTRRLRAGLLTFPHISVLSPNHLRPSANSLKPLNFRQSHPAPRLPSLNRQITYTYSSLLVLMCYIYLLLLAEETGSTPLPPQPTRPCRFVPALRSFPLPFNIELSTGDFPSLSAFLATLTDLPQLNETKQPALTEKPGVGPPPLPARAFPAPTRVTLLARC